MYIESAEPSQPLREMSATPCEQCGINAMIYFAADKITHRSVKLPTLTEGLEGNFYSYIFYEHTEV